MLSEIRQFMVLPYFDSFLLYVMIRITIYIILQRVVLMILGLNLKVRDLHEPFYVSVLSLNFWIYYIKINIRAGKILN